MNGFTVMCMWAALLDLVSHNKCKSTGNWVQMYMDPDLGGGRGESRVVYDHNIVHAYIKF